jgi:hypothetical protein
MSVELPHRAALRFLTRKVSVEITPEVLRRRAHFDEAGGASRAGSGATAAPHGAEALPDQTAHAQKKIGRHRGDVVAPVIRTAQHLTRLRPLVRKTWARQLAGGVNTPVAGHYLKFGNSWPGQIDDSPVAPPEGAGPADQPLARRRHFVRSPGPRQRTRSSGAPAPAGLLTIVFCCSFSGRQYLG